MKNRIIFSIFIFIIIFSGCSTEIEQDIAPTAPSASYQKGTYTPSAPTIILAGSSGALKAIICWTNFSDDTAISYNVYRNSSLIGSIDKENNGPEDGLYYFYIDTAPEMGSHDYNVESVGFNGEKASSLVNSVECSNFKSTGSLSGTYFDITFSGQKIYIGGASIIAYNFFTGRAGGCKSDADGNFSINGLPAGTYTVNFYHPYYSSLTSISVTIIDNQTKTTNVEY